MSMLGLAAAAAAICSRSLGLSEWAVRFLTESRSFFSALPAVSAGVKVRLRVGMGVRALTICSSVSGSAAEAGPRAAKNTAKAANAKAAGHLNIPQVFLIASLRLTDIGGHFAMSQADTRRNLCLIMAVGISTSAEAKVNAEVTECRGRCS